MKQRVVSECGKVVTIHQETVLEFLRRVGGADRRTLCQRFWVSSETLDRMMSADRRKKRIVSEVLKDASGRSTRLWLAAPSNITEALLWSDRPLWTRQIADRLGRSLDETRASLEELARTGKIERESNGPQNLRTAALGYDWSWRIRSEQAKTS